MKTNTKTREIAIHTTRDSIISSLRRPKNLLEILAPSEYRAVSSAIRPDAILQEFSH